MDLVFDSERATGRLAERCWWFSLCRLYETPLSAHQKFGWTGTDWENCHSGDIEAWTQMSRVGEEKGEEKKKENRKKKGRGRGWGWCESQVLVRLHYGSFQFLSVTEASQTSGSMHWHTHKHGRVHGYLDESQISFSLIKPESKSYCI